MNKELFIKMLISDIDCTVDSAELDNLLNTIQKDKNEWVQFVDIYGYTYIIKKQDIEYIKHS